MQICRLLVRATLGAAILVSSALAAGAEPTISMPYPGWKSKKIIRGTEFSCADEQVCKSEAYVIFLTNRVLSNTEDELNKPYTNIRAVVNAALLNIYNGGYGGWKLSEIRKSTTKDYTAIHTSGQLDGTDIAMMMIVQGGRSYLIASVATSPKEAKDNLAKAFKSGDFRRAP